MLTVQPNLCRHPKVFSNLVRCGTIIEDSAEKNLESYLKDFYSKTPDTQTGKQFIKTVRKIQTVCKKKALVKPTQVLRALLSIETKDNESSKRHRHLALILAGYSSNNKLLSEPLVYNGKKALLLTHLAKQINTPLPILAAIQIAKKLNLKVKFQMSTLDALLSQITKSQQQERANWVFLLFDLLGMLQTTPENKCLIEKHIREKLEPAKEKPGIRNRLLELLRLKRQ